MMTTILREYRFQRCLYQDSIPRCLWRSIKWQIALWLNHSPRTCWANLVMWHLGHYTFDAVWDGKSCAKEGRECDGCYCGKFHSPAPGQGARDVQDAYSKLIDLFVLRTG